MYEEGVTLSYRGKKLSSEDKDDAKGLAKLVNNFTQMGSLGIYFANGIRQRASLIQQICQEDYAKKPVQNPAEGNNQADLFATNNSLSPTIQATRFLEESALSTLGRGKVLNERGQPLKHHNTKELRGEAALFDILHTPLWNTGINLPYQLNRQGFIYINHPLFKKNDQYEQVNQDLREGRFAIELTSDTVLIKTLSGEILQTEKLSALQLEIDAEHRVTTQENAWAVSSSNDNTQAPMGWIIHTPTKKILDQYTTENLLRAFAIAKGGFHTLTPKEQDILISGVFKRDTFSNTQNLAFNGLYALIYELEKDFAFDSSALMQSSIKNSYSRMQTLLKDSDILEDFLTGVLISEMVQPLKLTQKNSDRMALPNQFSQSFKMTSNNAKAIAYAYELQNQSGQIILRHDGENTFVQDEELFDLKVEGKLQNPSLINSKHIAALLATAQLVVEQMIVEQLLRDACQQGNSHPNALALKKILQLSCENSNEVYQTLVSMASTLPSSGKYPKLGLQFHDCQEIVKFLRETLHFDSLLQFIKELSRDKNSERQEIELSSEIAKILQQLYQITNILQNLPGISATDQHSRGIFAGLDPVINKLCPMLHQQLVLGRKEEVAPRHATMEPTEERDTKPDISMCPFLSAKSEPAKFATKPKQSLASNWCSYFARRVLPATLMGVSAVVTASYLSNP